MQAYGQGFAQIYNLRWNDFSDTVAPYLTGFLNERGLQGAHVLDLCCGTGRLSRLLLEQGHTVTGLDLSPHMLEHARRNCEAHVCEGRATFVLADAADYTLPRPVDAVLSTYDALNHLPGEDALRGCFRSTHAALRPGGWFVFDLNTALGLEGWSCMSVRELEDALIIMRGAFDRERERAWTTISGFCRDDRDRWNRFSETIFNYCHPMADVLDWLRKAGFTQAWCARLRELNTPLADPETERRVFVAAQA